MAELTIKEKTKEAWKAWQDDQKTNPEPVNPHAFVYGYETAMENTRQEKINFAQKVAIKVSKIQKANITLLDQSTIDKIINEILEK